jgi:hypothetical protein
MKRLLLLLLFLPFLIHAQEKLDEHWYSLVLEGITVGFLHQTSWHTAEGLIRSEIEQTMEIHRFGVPFSMTQTDVWIEQRDGALVSVSSELDMNGQVQRIEARVLEQELRVSLRRDNEADEFALHPAERPRGLYSVDQEIAVLIAGQDAERELDYRLFSPETMKIEEFHLRVLGPGELADSLGGEHRGVLVEERSSSLPGIVTTEVYDGRAEFLYSKTPVGLELEILRLEGDPREGQAGTLSAEPGAPPGGDLPEEFAAVFDVASLTLPIGGLGNLSLENTEALTVVFRGQGVPLLYASVRSAEEDLASAPVAGAGNQVEAEPGGRTGAGCSPLRIVSAKEDAGAEVSELVLRLVNCEAAAGRAEPGSAEPFGPGAEAIPEQLRCYLKGGFHLDLDDPRLEELIDRCSSSGDGEDGGSPRCLERLVDRYIRKKSLAYGFAGLGEVLSSREGDCTEHALLLVALLRKAGVPSRIAYGLILTEVGFIGHAWAELYAGGHWRWLDPSFPGGRPYGLKIRLGVMDPAEPVWASLSLALLQVVGSVEGEILEAELR